MQLPIRNLKTAGRTLRAYPGFSLLVIGMLALGIGGNTAIFSIFNGLFLRPLPFAEPDRLVDLDETAPKWNLEYVGISNPDFHAWRADNRAFDRMSFYTTGSFNLSGHGVAQRVRRARVTHDMLSVLRLKPALGRDFLPEDDRPGAARVALLGYDLWQRLFNGSPQVLGRVLELDKQPYTVIGVLPRTAVFPSNVDLWVPLAEPVQGTGWYLNGIGRIKRGVSVEQARADLLRVHRAQIQAGQKENDITSPRIAPLRERFLGDLRPVSYILLGAVGIVLLIACVNIAGLMMVRGASRTREIGIRTAMGASRGAIVRQLLSESMVFALIGGVAGVALGAVMLRGMVSLMPEETPRWISFGMDSRFALFTAAVTGAAALLFGLFPALQASGVDTRACLQDAAPRTSMSRGRRGLLSSLVVCEIALALVLLTGAGLVLQAFRNVLRVDPGFQVSNVLTFLVSLPDARYEKPEQRILFYENFTANLRTLPGVAAVGAAGPPPLAGHWGMFYTAEGAPPLGPNEQNPVTLTVTATPGYLETLRIRFLAGRAFDARDGETGRTYAIINESFAKHYFPNTDPVGKRIKFAWTKDEWMQVIGVTADVKHYGLDQEMRPSVYLPHRQQPHGALGVMIRTAGDPAALAAPAREVLRRLDPDLPMFDVRPMSENVSRSLWARRAYSTLFASFACVALLLALAGMYGVVSYAVAQRTREIGVRIALGARPAQVMAQVLRHGMLLAAAGAIIGLGAALWAARFLRTILFGITARDPLTYTAVLVAVFGVALLANLAPARRAATVDPVQALRAE